MHSLGPGPWRYSPALLLAAVMGCTKPESPQANSAIVEFAEAEHSESTDTQGALDPIELVMVCASEDRVEDAAPAGGSVVKTVAVGSASAVAVRVPPPPVEEYRGKYASDPEFARRVATLRSELVTAMSTVGTRLALHNGPPPRVRVRLRDALTVRPKHAMTVHTEDGDLGSVQVLTVITEPLMAGAQDLSRSVMHEAVHCWHLSRRGRESRRTPPWISEGVAQWMSGDGEDAVSVFLNTECVTTRETGPLLSRAFQALLRWDTIHWYSYAAISFAQSLVPPARGDEFARSLLFDDDWPRTMECYTGLDVDAYLTRLAPWVEGDIARRLAGVEEFWRAQDDVRSGNLRAAAEGFREFTKRYPHHALTARAYYEWGRCLYRCGHLGSARTRLLDSRAAWPHSPFKNVVDRVVFLIDCRLGDREDIRDRGERLTRDYSFWRPESIEEIEVALRALDGSSEDANGREDDR